MITIDILDFFHEFQQRKRFRRELQLAINACQTIEELRRLVYLTQNKDEAIDKAFCKRLEELEAEGQVF